ncbi:hypothetical protein DEJ51_04540 [Streptomyces venezuelae]|uniref:Uncharacterized protein n=1 Tax=Streptomyces venezuelae TaxID=54571 RepID=A0A5P2DL01_STRVZ|nr:hypothetical protein DEJ51_04540 [Streptomyces venezuelae]
MKAPATPAPPGPPGSRTRSQRLGRSSPVITRGYYAHFMPEAGKGPGTLDGLLGSGVPGVPAGTPRMLPSAVEW